ncbi:pyrroline-5-carboxylate reductase [Microaerobacter geothermalis]|uniref:pyrroline-5-carboxylate reductase n=1 Tax=Microaerobacter geothermalis TaxID=674972 RepID=UPI001F2E8743|nr:pyrroline-5-carboxylate reductase [Microaerobacter geothermalis]MCF6093647.1 pyrroline-5-carboxylate reductase [Microaerobacter geothermalis]
MLDLQLGFIGAGSMAEAMITGILRNQLLKKDNIWVTNRENKVRLDELRNKYGIQMTEDKKELLKKVQVVVLAMKPKDMEHALDELKEWIYPSHLLISVAAGVSTQVIEESFPYPVPIIRAMPNTSSTIGLSATALCKGNWATPHHIETAKEIFRAIGSVCEVEEKDIDIVTGLSGSGPAYVYYLVEALMGAGIREGLEPEVARELTIQTLLGAAQMLITTKEEPSLLRKKVTSPGGTTMAGLQTLDDYRFVEAIHSAVARATERSREMGQFIVNARGNRSVEITNQSNL